MLRNVGEMKHRIVFQRNLRSGECDAAGNPLEEWTEAFRAWAHVEDASGKEFFSAGAVQSELSTVFTVRYLDIEADMRILYKGNIYEVTHVGAGRNVGDLLFIRAKMVRKEGERFGGNEGWR